MRSILILLIVFSNVVNIGYSQDKSTFFITRKSEPNNVRLVLYQGDKLKVKYAHDNHELQIKGKLQEIGDSFIVVENEQINIEDIQYVIVHNRQLKILGGLVFTAGTALITAGLIRKNNPKIVENKNDGFLMTDSSTYDTVVYDGSTMIAVGGILCTISTPFLFIPITYTKRIYRFSTYISGETK
ncbi:MAG: hypothetical protein EP333_07575 [Bacteroidetes bacterium]|nr:MAG: hypothetical protein EP333_07575 [Bacteroidota bacterium]